MRKLCCVILIGIFIAVASFAGEVMSLDGFSSEPILGQEILQSDVNGMIIRLNASAFGYDTVEFEEGQFTKVFWENSGVEGAVGNPEIPVYRFFIEIPMDAFVDVEIMRDELSEVAMSKFAAKTQLVPVQAPLEKIPGAVRTFTKNQNAYEHDSFAKSATIEITDYVTIRGHRMAVVTCRLLEYNPKVGTLRFHENLEFELSFVGGDLGTTAVAHQRYASPLFDNMVDELVENASTFELDELPNPPRMIIVSSNAQYADALEPFVTWKKQKGYAVDLVSTTETGTTTQSIKTYLQNEYSSEIPPSFVILVGDTPAIPHWTGGGEGSPATDLNYGCLDGTDYFTDICISRFSVENVTDLENIVRKALEYEQVGWSGRDDSWIKEALWMAGNDNHAITEGTHNAVIGQYFDPRGYISHRVYRVSEGATTSDTRNNFNAGRGLATYSGHGSETSWADGPPFSQSDVNNLTNDVYTFVQSYACVTGKFERSGGECFSETWTRATNGCFAFMGSSVNSYWTEDDILERRMYEGLFDNQTQGETHNYTWVNGLVNYAKSRFYQHFGGNSTTRRYFEMYNILGDGSAVLWTEAPMTATVDCPGTFLIGTSSMDVTVTGIPEWALIHVESEAEEGVEAFGYTDANGGVHLEFASAPSIPGILKMTVTGYNVRPYMADIQVIAPDGAYIIADTLIVNDTEAWNPNNVADYGETVSLSLRLKNVGVDPSEALDVTISCEDETVVISDATETYSAIPADETGIVDDGFVVGFPSDVTAGVHPVALQVTATAGEETWNSTINLTLNAPKIEIPEIRFEEITGNGNGSPDNGESVRMYMTLKNTGTSVLPSGTAGAYIEDQHISMGSQTVEFGELLPGATTEVQYILTIDGTASSNYEVEFEVGIVGNGWESELSTSFVLNNPLASPVGPDAYGYLCYDANDGDFAVDYNWIEIAASEGGSGTEISLTEDDDVATFDLPFTFKYYGVMYLNGNVSSNGWMNFGAVVTDADYSNSGIPNSDGPSAMVAAYWDDLNPERGNSGGVWKWYDETNHRFIIEYNHYEQYDPRGAFETYQVILLDPEFYPTETGDGIIIFQYKEVSATAMNEGTVGIENSLENTGLQICMDGQYPSSSAPITAETALVFYPGAPVELQAPENLTVELNTQDATVALAWEYNTPSLQWMRPGASDDSPVNDEGKPNNDNTEELNDLDDFLRFRIMRSSGDSFEQIAETVELSYSDQLTEYGNYSYYVIAVYDEGMSRGSNVQTVAYVDDAAQDDAAALPKEFAISDTYPNPFNPSVNVVIAVPAKAKVKAIVFDMLGREVTVLADGQLTAGYHTLNWTAQGASGIYFVRVENERGWSSVRKLVFMK